MADMELHGVPAHIASGLQMYIEHHIIPGGFLQSVLENDLREAVVHADRINRYALADIMDWIRHYAPPECWGSPEKVTAWLAKRATEETDV